MVKVEIDHNLCGGAGECIAVCPNGVWTWKKVKVKIFGMFERERMMPVPIHQERCTGCMRCFEICPTGCIKIIK
jgi:2-oxoglutarate ferredoxin oxidoreductase subunit delta